MTEVDVFIAAEAALTNVVKQIKADQWEMKLPEWFPVGGTQKDLVLRQIINYHVYDDAWVPEVLAGKTAVEVGDKYDGDLLGDDPKGNWHKYMDLAITAVKALDDLDKMVHLSYGDLPAREYLKHITSFRGLRVYDLAKLIGADTTMPDDLVKGLWWELEPAAEAWRQMGVFGPKVEVPASAPLQDRLLGLTGRQPSH